MPPHKVSSIDVARLAGVSQSTVSRTFTAGAKVTPEKQARVLAAARELGYKPNAIARSMSTSRTRLIGMVMPHITAPFYPEVLQEITRELALHDLRVLFFNVSLENGLKDTLPLALQYQVDAIIITSITLSSDLAEECKASGTPVILFNRYSYESSTSAVSCDNVHGGALAADVLVGASGKRFAFVAGETEASTSVDREEGFSRRMREHGVESWLREQGDFTHGSGYAAALRMLDHPDYPDAIFCANDQMAMGVIDAARSEFGMRVPDDFSIVGFDDTLAAGWPPYELTTIRQPLETMVDATVDLLLALLEDPEMESVKQFFPGRLIRRRSVK